MITATKKQKDFYGHLAARSNSDALKAQRLVADIDDPTEQALVYSLLAVHALLSSLNSHFEQMTDAMYHIAEAM